MFFHQNLISDFDFQFQFLTVSVRRSINLQQNFRGPERLRKILLDSRRGRMPVWDADRLLQYRDDLHISTRVPPVGTRGVFLFKRATYYDHPHWVRRRNGGFNERSKFSGGGLNIDITEAIGTGPNINVKRTTYRNYGLYGIYVLVQYS